MLLLTRLMPWQDLRDAEDAVHRLDGFKGWVSEFDLYLWEPSEAGRFAASPLSCMNGAEKMRQLVAVKVHERCRWSLQRLKLTGGVSCSVWRFPGTGALAGMMLPGTEALAGAPALPASSSYIALSYAAVWQG